MELSQVVDDVRYLLVLLAGVLQLFLGEIVGVLWRQFLIHVLNLG